MKLVLDLKNEPTEDDVLIFDGKQWKCIKKAQLLNDMPLLKKEVNDFKEETKESLESFKKQINEKLSEYHKILQTLTKGE